ncbi:Hint domain-containing protein [Jannaschia aquimarina]|uniref:Hedgehog/Intein (Hint) domain-containing protein n=1 Tax=Jannaschia aquimarina TaxID=935700 RepID=A0A0D1EET8_9RHOB|nr:Hint domain-containing protein [Jannaschia aquimarina]KIT14390.1 hypothetical protein jaqu_38940 [Jannaschia aquimarina]SNS77872.1 Hint domain-containing protein [Jannaschia aquimarina]
MCTESPPEISRCSVIPAEAFVVEAGAMAGDPIGGLTDVVAGDLYTLAAATPEQELLLQRGSDGPKVAPGSSVGRVGEAVKPVARHQMMGERGANVEILVLETGGARFALPLGPLSPMDEYTLISSEAAEGELGSVASVSFARGTAITLAGGLQCPVEDLSVGDRVLTRDHGPRPILWIGRQTVRAEGANAPVEIGQEAMGNARTLVLSPDHRLYIYQRREGLGVGGREVLVRARHLVNGDTIRRHAGGHIDYFHLLFDAHEIIYAEGIPAESLLVSPDILAGLDEDLAAQIASYAPPVPRSGFEPSAADLEGLDAASILRRASTG